MSDKCCRCFAGIDVRRRGTSGTQADLYIYTEVLIRRYL
jgi:hypothetical protein